MAMADASNCLVAVFLNNGDGTFTESGTYHAGGYQPSGSIVAADVNGDKKLDIIVSTGGGSSSFSVLLGNGDGTFQSPIPYSNGTSSGSDDLVVADVNGDGKPDVISDSQNGSANASFYVSRGNGDCTFSTRTSHTSLVPRWWREWSGLFRRGRSQRRQQAGYRRCTQRRPALVNRFHPIRQRRWDVWRPGYVFFGHDARQFCHRGFQRKRKTGSRRGRQLFTPQVSLVLGNGDGTFQTPSS